VPTAIHWFVYCERCDVHCALIYFTQTALYLERGGSEYRTTGLIFIHCDVEVCANTHHHCCPHLYLGPGIQHSRACKKYILKLIFSYIVKYCSETGKSILCHAYLLVELL
jgi:hypothetical protein